MSNPYAAYAANVRVKTPARDDSPELVKVKLDLANLQVYLWTRQLTEANFILFDAALKSVWRRFSELDKKGRCHGA